MKSNQLRLIVISMGMFLLFSLGNGLQAQTTGWNITPAIKATKNPVPTSKESKADGKELYNKHCKSCHGTMGKGDGPKAAELETETGDFSKMPEQTDGEILYKVKEGRDDMPSFKKKITDDEDIWNIVNYVKTFKKK